MNDSTPYYADEHVILHLGDALEVTRTLPDASVDCIVTSPPYFGLRDYGATGQYGHEGSIQDYVGTLSALFRETRRVLANDGTLWLNIGDSYRNKQLVGAPWRTAFALQDDGWLLRSEIIWHKRNPLPESVKDRPSKAHEHVFMFSKSKNHYFDLDEIREPYSPDSLARYQYGYGGDAERREASHIGGDRRKAKAITPNARGKNPGDVWSLGNKTFRGAHFAVFPPEIPRRAILAGCKPGGTVLDPFSGSGTTGMVAHQFGRKYIGIDINSAYHDLALSTRLPRTTLDVLGGAA